MFFVYSPLSVLRAILCVLSVKIFKHEGHKGLHEGH